MVWPRGSRRNERVREMCGILRRDEVVPRMETEALCLCRDAMRRARLRGRLHRRLQSTPDHAGAPTESGAGTRDSRPRATNARAPARCPRTAPAGGDPSARLVSLPCHHTRMMAEAEGRSPSYVEACLSIPESGPLPDAVSEIMDRVADRDVVFDTGHVAGPGCVRVVEEAAKRGCRRILCPASYFDTQAVSELVRLGATEPDQRCKPQLPVRITP